MKIEKDTTLREFLEDMLGHGLNSETNAKAFGCVTVWEYATYLAEGGPRSTDRSVRPPGWGARVLSTARSAGPSLQHAGRVLLKRHGSAPRPDWLKGKATGQDDESTVLAEVYRAFTGESEETVSPEDVEEALETLFI